MLKYGFGIFLEELPDQKGSVKPLPLEVRPLIEETCGPLSEPCPLVEELPLAAPSLCGWT